MVKMCRYHPEFRCYLGRCDGLDGEGNVVLCRFHLNPEGLHVPRIAGFQSHGIFDKVRVNRRGR